MISIFQNNFQGVIKKSVGSKLFKKKNPAEVFILFFILENGNHFFSVLID